MPPFNRRIYQRDSAESRRKLLRSWRDSDQRWSEVQNESTESAFEEHEDQLTEERREDEEESLLIDEDQTQAEDADDDFRSSCRSSSY